MGQGTDTLVDGHVGLMGASAIVATVTDPTLVQIRRRVCRLARNVTTPELQWRQGTVGKHQQGGNKYICSLLIAGAIAVLRHARNRATRDGEWVRGLLGTQSDQSRRGRAG